jgi:hypothetical protein
MIVSPIDFLLQTMIPGITFKAFEATRCKNKGGPRFGRNNTRQSPWMKRNVLCAPLVVAAPPTRTELIRMNVRLLATAAAIAAFGIAGAQAQQSATPGHTMQQNGSVNGTAGASGYTPGHKMQEKGSVKGTVGSSGYAPGRAGASAGTSGSVRTPAAGANVNGGAHAGGSMR